MAFSYIANNWIEISKSKYFQLNVDELEVYCYLCNRKYAVFKIFMGKILDFIQQHSAGKYFCYGSKKVSLDDNINDVLSFDDKTVSEAKKSVFAETDPIRIHTVNISPSFIQGCTPIFRFFLDGSRRTYKVDDIAIGKKIFPIVAGQIIVGCCERKDRETFKPYLLHHRIVLSMPTDLILMTKTTTIIFVSCIVKM